jgi:hypothetical protein
MQFSPAEMQAVLGGIRCDKMTRAWRNRSNVTRWKWEAAARDLLGDSKHAGALYVACGELCNPPDWTFDGATWPPEFWENLARRLPGFVNHPPEKALSRWQYEQRRNQRKTSRADVCHQLYAALQLWRTGEALSRADVWRVTEAAERAYRTLFPNPPKRKTFRA